MAAFFVNSTSSHIYLTGKAGTGKTTFLKSLAKETHKNFVIVAPTGIAALNAGGVTIHSQFQLPLGTFLPDKSPSGTFNDSNSIYTQYTLSRKHPISSARKQVLRSIELLIIDEVSMLRSDVLDAIDYRMRSVRGNYQQSFGGVQVLLIGDLYQLPPIVKDHEWNYLRRFYRSAHFFEAKALQTEGFVFIELEKIFRQTDDTFIRVLNNLRNNITTNEDIETLNKYYQPPSTISHNDNVITITTHNYKADELNQNALNRLQGDATEYFADIEDDFPESIFPIPQKLVLKKGAQVMFVKNDSSGSNRYFNGKIAKVIELNREEIFVELEGSKDRFKLEKEEWENKKYSVNSNSKELDETIIGRFQQYPIKLAWAVTVHKSQGLTFDRAIIDVGQAFAPGQVYVALSRLRSLDGLILRTKIDTKVITSDPLVVEFSDRRNLQPALEKMLTEKQGIYLHELVNQSFSFQHLISQISKLVTGDEKQAEFEDESMRNAMQNILQSFESEIINTQKFRLQLTSMIHQKDYDSLGDRLLRGSEYYKNLLKKNIFLLLQHINQVTAYSGTKTYLNLLSEIDHLMMKKLDEVEKSGFLIDAIIRNEPWNSMSELRSRRENERLNWLTELGAQNRDSITKSSRKTGKVRKKSSVDSPKKEKKSTVLETMELYRSGLSIDEIAKKRSLVSGTIESHFSKAIMSGEMNADEWMNQSEIDEVASAKAQLGAVSSKEIYAHLKGKYSYAKINLVAFLSEQKSS